MTADTITVGASTAAATTARAIRSVLPSGTEDVSPILFKRLSDERLGSRLASGEAAAFDELYRRYVHRLAAYGSHLLGDPAAGDDVAQATLLKAYGALRDGRVPDKMRPWLFRIAHNTAIDLVVRRRELPTDEVPEIASRDPEPLAGALVTALAALPERQCRVYVLRELHGMRIAEAAAELGVNSTQVEQALFAARNRLAELLVFGDRLDCVTVQRLAAGPLDATERRALKTHLRSCAQCRKAVPLRSRAPVWLPGPSLEWLRGLLVGGAGPAAAKVGAVVATATIAGSVPVVARDVEPHPELHKAPTHVRSTALHARAPVAKTAHVVVVRAPAAVPTEARPTHEQVRRRRSGRDDSTVVVSEPKVTDRGGHDTSSGPPPPATVPLAPIVDSSGPSSGDGGGGVSGGDDHPAVIAPVAPAPTSTVLEDRSGSSGSGGSGDSGPDGGSDGGSHGGDDGRGSTTTTG
jgi:RNA polymerase sigma factor (sigma-70 family)